MNRVMIFVTICRTAFFFSFLTGQKHRENNNTTRRNGRVV